MGVDKWIALGFLFLSLLFLESIYTESNLFSLSIWINFIPLGNGKRLSIHVLSLCILKGYF